jgi:hypothetical protein
MKRPRRNHSAAFEAKVALTAIKGEHTLAAAGRAVRCASQPDHAVKGRTAAARQIDEATLAIGGATQVLHCDAHELARQEFDQPLIFDLSLDLFNDSRMEYQSELWPDSEIAKFLATIKPLVQRADVVTLSLSFGCSGTQDDTRRLAKMIVPELVQWRSTEGLSVL